jgi:hypothetical protein
MLDVQWKLNSCEIVGLYILMELSASIRPVRLAYQPPASSTFLSQQTSNQQPASSTILSEQISISHQPTEQAVVVMKLLKHMILLLAVELILS